MTNVDIYLGDIFLTGSLDEFVQSIRQRVIFAATEQQESFTAGTRLLGWPTLECEDLVRERFDDTGFGPVVASIPLADISRLSFFRFRKCVERIAVDAVDHLGSNYALRRFFSAREEDVIRRIKISPETEVWASAWRVRFALD